MRKCFYPNCNRDAETWFCREHFLLKEKSYGWWDIKTLNRGFIWWGIKRCFRYYWFKLTQA